MAKASHHAACVTDGREAVEAFLTGVIGLQPLLKFHSSGEGMTRRADGPPVAGPT